MTEAARREGDVISSIYGAPSNTADAVAPPEARWDEFPDRLPGVTKCLGNRSGEVVGVGVVVAVADFLGRPCRFCGRKFPRG